MKIKMLHFYKTAQRGISTLFLCVSVLFSLLLTSCKEDYGNYPFKRVKVTIKDVDGKVVKGAKAKVFYLYNDFLEEKNAIGEEISDENGVLYLTMANDLTAKYYLSVEKDSLNNWYTSNSIYVPNAQNLIERTVIIKQAPEGILAGKSSRTWIRTAYVFNGTKYTDCDYTYNHKFEIYIPEDPSANRIGIVKLTGKKGCPNEGESIGLQSWVLDDIQDNALYIDHGKREILKLSENYLVIRHPDAPFEIQEYFERIP